jgi:Putative auto-transporter adhesin, head GIN domain
MSYVKFLSLIVVVLLLSGCCALPFGMQLVASGPLVTKDYDLGNFTAVNAGSAFQVEITRSDKYGVSVTVNENLVERLDIGVSGSTLHIGLKSGYGISGAATMRAKVTLPELAGLDLSGASHTTVSGFNSDRSLKTQVSGASTLGGDLTCGDAQFDVSGASKVQLTGSAQDQSVEASGASTVDLSNFASKNTVVSASGASKVSVAPSGTLTVEASGASAVRYSGEPAKLKTNSSGASTVEQQ